MWRNPAPRKTHVERNEDMEDGERRDDDGEKCRGPHHTDDAVISLLNPDVCGEAESAANKDEVDAAEEERRERVVEDEVLEARPFRVGGRLIARELERILEVAGVFVAAEGCPGCRPARSLQKLLVSGRQTTTKDLSAPLSG